MATFQSNKATFINDLQSLLEGVTGERGISFKQNYDEWSHDLTSMNLGLESVLYNDRYVEIIPLEEKLFLSVCISWYKGPRETMEGNSKLKNISLIFFHFDKLLCKAEWAFEQNEDDPTSEHPQPHWHFVKDFEDIVERPIIQHNGFAQESKIKADTAVHVKFGEERPATTSAEKVLIEDDFSSKRMHFAMCSRWTEGYDENPHFEGRKQLFNWIELCIISVKEQHELHGD